MTIEKTTQAFKDYLARIKMFKEASAILSFDSETVAPPGSVKARAKRAGFFEVEIFKMETAPEMKEFLELLEPHLDSLDDELKGMYRISKKAYDKGTKIPAKLVQAFGELKQEASVVWAKARKENDFQMFAPYLKRLLELQKEVIHYRGDNGQAYDLLLGDYEEGMTMVVYDEFFAKLKETVVPLLKQIRQSEKKIDMDFVNHPVSLEAQRELSKFIGSKIGYDLERGYITESTHPFCNGSNKYDVRITTRYLETDFLSSLYSILHECGHAIYDQGIRDDITTTILGKGASMGIHESQSRFYENIIGRNRVFWEALKDELMTYLPAQFNSITPQKFYEATNEVKPSFIRVEADELTYNLHVVIRYEIEKMLFAEAITVDDLPQVWNQKFEEYLGITPPTDTVGVLQDIHWSLSAFGYFPTYALGSAYAAQISAHMQKELDIDELLKKQDFLTIKRWLNEKIHQYGLTYTPSELMKKSFNETFNADYYITYLKEKFSKLYEI